MVIAAHANYLLSILQGIGQDSESGRQQDEQGEQKKGDGEEEEEMEGRQGKVSSTLQDVAEYEELGEL